MGSEEHENDAASPGESSPGDASPPVRPASSSDASSSEEKSASERKRPTVPVVGIGASAGGLDAFERFLDTMPANSGMAFVLVQHLDPDRESQLAELLQHHTRMPVQQLSGATPVQADHVYVIPPNKSLTIEDGVLQLHPIEAERVRRAPIDLFLRSLAADQGERAVGIVLSGTGHEGALGLRAIKEAGGLTMVQDPDDAAYDSMPQHALQAGGVDVALPAGQLPERLLRYVQHAQQEGGLGDAMRLADAERSLPDDVDAVLDQIFDVLRSASGNDFSRYKRSTVLRRLGRRMQVHQMDAPSGYLAYLRKHPEEIDALFQDLLISVTSFFRDPELFEALENEVIPQIVADKDAGAPIRTWVVGCATGEEAYSVAMLLHEHAAQQKPPPALQVFATDIDRNALSFARRGVYPESIAADLVADRLERFFVREGSTYRVRSELSDIVLFAEHNLLTDPPFLNLDLISCRNLLIYLERDLQESVFALFHYALRPTGYVFLGASESPPGDSALFKPVAGHSTLLRREVRPEGQPRLPTLPMWSGERTEVPSAAKLPVAQRDRLAEKHRKMVLARYGKPSVLVNSNYDVMHVLGNADRYLRISEGDFTRSIIDMVDPAVRLELRSMLHQLFHDGTPPDPRRVHLKTGEARQVVRLIVTSADADGDLNLAQVLFEDEELTAARRDTTRADPPDGHAHSGEGRDAGSSAEAIITQLEDELERTRDELRATVQEYETTNEELRASNEELQSMNEELKSTAEELETSKEELQSMNEELTTINQELQNKIEELNRANSDLQNLLSATDIAILFLDRELRLRRYTPPAEALFNVIPSDVGRPLKHLTHRLQEADLADHAKQVLDELAPVDREVESDDGKWYIMRILPYRTIDDRIDGLVVSFIDITERRRAEEALREAKRYAEYIVETIQEPLLVLTPDLRVKSANPAFYDAFEARPKTTQGQLIYELGNGQWDIPELRTLLGEVLPENGSFSEYLVEHEFETIGYRAMLLNGRRLDGQDLILLSIHDITKQKEAEQAIREAKEKAETQARVRASFLGSISHEIRTPLSGLLGFADMLARQLDGREEEIAALVRRSGERLLETMDSILDLARMEAGGFEPDWEQLDAVQEIQEAVQLLEPIAQQKGDVALRFESPLTACPAMLDRGYLNRIVNNLVGNAIKYTPDGQVTVRLATEAGTDAAGIDAKPDGTEGDENLDRDEIVLTVSDTGVGISASFLPHVFDEFRQEDAAIANTEGGAGLGLTLTKHLVETLGGTISAQSTKGEGSTFTVRIPWNKPG